jgi:hypothetical protein
MDSKKTIMFSGKNVKSFTAWLKRFASIDNSLLLEIDEKTSTFIAKAYNEEHSVVKMSRIKFDDAGLTIKLNKDPKRIEVGIFNIPRLIKIIDQFNDVEFILTVIYQDIKNNDSSVQYAGEKILLNSKNLKMSVDCTSLNIFQPLSDNKFNNEIAAVDEIGTFELSKSNIEKINSLCTLDNEDKFIEFKFKDNEVLVSGKTFELTICEIVKTAATIKVYKEEQYSNIDIENYMVQMGEDRLVFKSKDSDTVCVLSMTTDSE